MSRIVTLLLAILLSGCASTRTVTLLHFSDYHSHAVPFYSEGERDAAGIARAIAWLRPWADRDDTLIFSGGDTINRGSPAWSDKFSCVEWPWLNGIVDAMAFGNHDADYGDEEFGRCAALVEYPILRGEKPWTMFERSGVRIGVFAVPGPDFPQLLKREFPDPVSVARTAVAALRAEGADAVVMIGHEHSKDDEALAGAVPGIDLIFGTHSHEKSELHQISGTDTWTISPFQYLTYVSRVAMRFDGRRLSGVDGELVRMSASLPEDPVVASRVATLQKELESDPKYAELFRVIAEVPQEISVERLGTLTTAAMAEVTGARCGVSTASSFRAALPAGPVREEDLRNALPYDNEIVLVRAPLPSEFEAHFSSCSGEGDLIAITDYMARTAAGYRDYFSSYESRPTGVKVRDVVRKALQRHRAAP